jgi:hypothetical protein
MVRWRGRGGYDLYSLAVAVVEALESLEHLELLIDVDKLGLDC